jgi:catechol 2,3-dioxygenase-like lactoylglutathione lyase family enzyme
MRINVASVLVDDQDKALRFYTEVLGFVKKAEIPLGEHRWLTVVSPADEDGTELVLEPDSHPAAGPFKAALVADGIPWTSFAVDDVVAETERLRAAGVRFTRSRWRWARSRPRCSTTRAATSSRSPRSAERVRCGVLAECGERRPTPRELAWPRKSLPRWLPTCGRSSWPRATRSRTATRW